MSRTYCLVSVVLVLSLASTSFGLVIGDFEDGVGSWKVSWEVADKPALAVEVSEIGATSGTHSLAVSVPTGWAWAVMYEGLVDTTKYHAISADVTWVASEWVADAGAWVNFKDMAVNSDGPSGWKPYVPSDPCNPDWPGSWDPVNWGDHTRTLTWDISDYDASGATWMQIVFSSNMGGITTPGKFYVDNVRLIGEEAPPKKIIWVSFHGADDAPSADAVANGFTEAPDKAYTDLLTANGYDVTRYVTTKTPDVNMLNAADLVIIGRSVDSSHYGSDAATTWNTQITAPMIITGGYPLRKSRLGFTAGTTIPDTTGDIRLTVSDPNHPIFAGIAMTDGTMDNPFAGIVVYPTDGTTVARGISVNTDEPNPAGTVLATIAGPADPNDPNDPNDTFDPITGPIGGMMIAEWPARVTTLTHDGGAGTDVLAGRRLVFLTGSREASGMKSATAGMYDLYDDGAKMFLNAVAYMLTPKPVVIPVVNPSFEQPGTEKIKGWNGEGIGGTPAVDIPGWASDTAVVDSGVETGWTPTDGLWTAFLKGADPSVWQSTGFVVQANDVIELSVDARNTWQGTTLQMTLYYEDLGIRIPAARAEVAVTNTMQTFAVTLDATMAPDAVGKVLGIELDNITTNGESWIGLDNVRLILE